MPSLVLNDEQVAQLGRLDVAVEVSDSRGFALGHLVPKDAYLKLVYAWARTEFTDAELIAAKSDPGGMTTSELLESLERLEPHAPVNTTERQTQFNSQNDVTESIGAHAS